MTTTTTTTPTPGPYNESVDAIRGLRDGNDRWGLADALLAEVGPFDTRSKFDDVRTAAESAGVVPLGVSALRQYRDVAHHWPPGDRVPGVSFSAHRAALPTDDPRGLLTDLAAAHGPKGVTVKVVNDAVAVVAGNAPAPASTTPTVDLKSASARDLVTALANLAPDAAARDLKGAGLSRKVGGKVTTMTARDYLADVVAALDVLAAKSAAKSAAWSGKSVTTPAPAGTPAPTPAPKSVKGDVRGL